MKSQLAIIIPAYKAKFLSKALESLSNQTCKDFSLYIGDDASPEDLYYIVKQFEDRLNITFTRFDKNMGGTSLTAQWERCVNLSSSEPFIWLFSDDDEVSIDAVESFYNEINISDEYDLYRFSLSLIDEQGKIIFKSNYSEIESNVDFFKKRVNESVYSCAVNYIFKREIFKKCHGFVSLPFAWFADDASWIRFSENKEIKRITGGDVRWRMSDGFNISTSYKYEKYKVKAVYDYSLWFQKYFKNKISVKELNNLTRVFFTKRLSKMSLSNVLSPWNLIRLFKSTGVLCGMYLLTYDCFIRMHKLVFSK